MKKSITCTKCYRPLPSELFNTPDLTNCPNCGVVLRVDVFPAFFKNITPGRPGETLVVDNESSCFYHPQKKAVIPCDMCGRFLCALCDVDLNGRHLCPSCLESGETKGKLKSLQNHRTLYDGIALRLAIYPMILFFFWFFMIITAPIALFIAIRYWNAPSSIVPRTRIRSIIAIILASLQILGWGFFVWRWVLLMRQMF